MEPDRFAAVAADEQRAVIAVTEECLDLQAHLPAIPVEPDRHVARRVLIALVVLLLVLAAAYLAWQYMR